MDWKKENPKNRFIDQITWEEAKKIAFLAAGQPDEFELIDLKAECNGNNIPHVKIFFKYYEPVILDYIEDFIGIFSDLNTYVGENFRSVYCQVELFKAFNEMGFE